MAHPAEWLSRTVLDPVNKQYRYHRQALLLSSQHLLRNLSSSHQRPWLRHTLCQPSLSGLVWPIQEKRQHSRCLQLELLLTERRRQRQLPQSLR